MIRRALIVFIVLTAPASAALFTFLPSGQLIQSVNLSALVFPAGTSNATVGTLSAVMTPASPAFSGSFSVSGPDRAKFQVSGTSLRTSAALAIGSYTINADASQTGIGDSPVSKTVTLTALQSIGAVALSNNTFIGGSPSGTIVGALSVSMIPASPVFSGSLSLSTSAGGCNSTNGANNSSFQISGGNLGNLQTNGVVPSGTYAVCVAAAEAGTFNTPQGQPFTITGSSQSIASIALSNNTFQGGSPSGTVVGTLSATMNPPTPAFSPSGTWSLSTTAGGCNSTNGANNALFQISGGSNLATNGVVGVGTYAVCALATKAGISNSPLGQALTITGTQAIASISLSNNTIIQGPSGTVVGTLTVAMNPATPTFSGVLGLSSTSGGCNSTNGANNSSFQIVSNSTLETSGTVASGTYAVCVTASQGSATNSPLGQPFTITVNPAAFVVATNGSDTNPGTLASPFATLQKCQTAMQGSSTKICYIRAGTYTGGGVGYNAQTLDGGGWLVKVGAQFTSSDNGETIQYYPPDGYNTAIFDGGAGTWSTTGAATGCVVNSNPTGAVGWFIAGEGVNNFTINGLVFTNVCFGAVLIAGDNSDTAGCVVGNGGFARGNLIENNIIHNTSNGNAQCAGGFNFGGRAIQVVGDVQNTTITHNYLYNLTGGAITIATPNSSTIGNFSNSTIDHNLVVNVDTDVSDDGAIYLQDINHCNGSNPPNPPYICLNGESTNLQVQFNYVMGAGLTGCGGVGGPGQPAVCDNLFYNDDGLSNSTRSGNVAVGPAANCFFQHAGTNNTSTGNICDLGNVANVNGQTFGPTAWYWTSTGNAPSGSNSHLHEIDLANAASCFSNTCAGQNNDNTAGFSLIWGSIDYFNYGGANSVLTNAASSQGDPSSGQSGPSTTDPQFVKCPTNGQDSWGYVIGNAAGTGVFAAPVSFPAQPAGWATPGFWGPPAGPNWNGKIPHSLAPSFTAQTPSYGPTC